MFPFKKKKDTFIKYVPPQGYYVTQEPPVGYYVPQEPPLMNVIKEEPKKVMKKSNSPIINAIKYMKSNHNSVTYYLYKQKESLTTIPKHVDKFYQNQNTACFSGLSDTLRNKDDRYNRILYEQYKKQGNNVPLSSPKEIEAWIKLCQKYKVLPKNLIVDIPNFRYVIPLNKNMDINILFIYLTALRMIQESPGFVTNMLSLNRKTKLNFFVAWLLCSKVSMQNSNHNIVSPYSGGINREIEKISGIDIREAYNLKKLIKDRLAKAESHIYKGTHWRVSHQVYNSSNRHTVTIQELSNPLITKYMNASPKELNEIYNQIKS